MVARKRSLGSRNYGELRWKADKARPRQSRCLAKRKGLPPCVPSLPNKRLDSWRALDQQYGVFWRQFGCRWTNISDSFRCMYKLRVCTSVYGGSAGDHSARAAKGLIAWETKANSIFLPMMGFIRRSLQRNPTISCVIVSQTKS